MCHFRLHVLSTLLDNVGSSLFDVVDEVVYFLAAELDVVLLAEIIHGIGDAGASFSFHLP